MALKSDIFIWKWISAQASTLGVFFMVRFRPWYGSPGVQQFFFDLICDSAGCFSRLFWKMKKLKGNLQTSIYFFWYTRKKAKFWIMHGREISKTILTSIKQLPNKIKSKFLHKNRALLFWVPTLIICFRVDEFCFTLLRLFPRHQIFFQQPCVIHAFILWQTTSKVDLWNNT